MTIRADSARPRSAASEMPPGHLPVLDGLRGVAALMVVAVHTTTLQGATFADRAVFRMSSIGWIGVDLFFVLSGFLITGILADARTGPHVVRNFYIRRVLRIWPLYVAFLTLCFVIAPGITIGQTNFGSLGVQETLAYWLHLGNVAQAIRGYVPDSSLNVTWSLAVEEHFYLVWPAVAVLCNRGTAMRIAGGLIVAAPLFRLAMIGTGASPVAIYVLTPGRMDALAAGSWVALAARGPGGLAALRPAARRVFLGAAFAFLALLAGLFVKRLSWWGVETPFQSVGYSLLAVGFAAGLIGLVIAPRQAVIVRLLSHPLPRMFGKYSYAIYLFHVPVCLLFWALGWGPAMTPTLYGSQIPAQLAFSTGVIGTTFAFAWLSWHLYEKPFLSLKRFFPANGTVPAMMPARSRQPTSVGAGVALGV